MNLDPIPIRSRDRSPEEGPALPQPLPLIAVLDNLRSAFNVGSIFRTSEAARLRELILCGITPYPPNQRLDRTALGTVHRVSWRHSLSTTEVVRQLKREGIAVWALEVSERSVPIRKVAFPQPTAVVFGHEVAGVGPETLREADGIVEIPLYGRKNSLNVATTFGIVVFEILRQWGF
jgi:23S rRNA (guanosine2251-2'-O)-methyltransferase